MTPAARAELWRRHEGWVRAAVTELAGLAGDRRGRGAMLAEHAAVLIAPGARGALPGSLVVAMPRRDKLLAESLRHAAYPGATALARALQLPAEGESLAVVVITDRDVTMSHWQLGPAGLAPLREEIAWGYVDG